MFGVLYSVERGELGAIFFSLLVVVSIAVPYVAIGAIPASATDHSDGIPLSSCLGSDEPLNVTGATYYLTQNVSASGTCFEIQNDSITFDGMGYTITGLDIASTGDRNYGIYAGLNARTDITIRNVTVEGYTDDDGSRFGANSGIHLRSVDGGTIQDVILTGNNNGIALDTMDGIDGSHNVSMSNVRAIDNDRYGILFGEGGGSPASSNQSTLSDSTIENNGVAGIRFTGESSHNRILDTNITGNGEYGIRFSGGTGNEVIGNSITGQVTGDGIWVAGSAQDVLIEGNNVSGNAGTGVYLGSTSGNTISDNTVVQNDEGGIELSMATENVLSRNTVSSNGDNANGIALGSGSDGNTLTANTIEAQYFGIIIGNSVSNVLEDNTVRGNLDSGVYVYGGSDDTSLTGTTARNNSQTGIYLRDSANISLTNGVSTGNQRHGIRLLETTNVTVTGATTTGNLFTGIELSETVDVIVRESDATNNTESGVRVTGSTHTATGSTNTSLTNVTASQNGNWSVLIDEASSNSTVEFLDIGASTAANTTLSFTGEEVGVRANATPPTNAEATEIGRFFEVESQGDGATLTVDIHYESADVVDVNESNLTLWSYGGQWTEFPSTVDDANRTVTATITDSSTFGVFETVADDGDPGSDDSTNEAIEFSSLAVSDAERYTGQSTAVSATVENTASEERSFDATLAVDGATVDSQNGTLLGGESKTVTFFYQFDTAGSVAVSIGDLPAETVSVTEAWTQFGFGDDKSGSGVELTGPTGAVEERWNYTVSSESHHSVRSSPAVVDGVVYVGSWPPEVHAINATDGSEVWVFATDGPITTAPAVADGVVYATSSGTGGGTVYAIDAETGTEEWSVTVGTDLQSSPVVFDGVVYVGSDDNYVHALDATDGTEMWTFETGDEVRTSPAVAKGVVYVGSNDGNVYALDAVDGSELWRFNVGTWQHASPAVVDGTVYVGVLTGDVHALDAENGTEQWHVTLGGMVESSPAVVDGVLFVGSNDNQVYALDATDGSDVWNTTTGGPVKSSPGVVDGVVYVGSDDNHVYALNADDGSEEWAFETGDVVQSSPAVLDGVAYVGSSDATVYAIAEEVTPASIEVVGAGMETTAIQPGETARVFAQVSNSGDESGAFTVRLEVDGETITTQNVSVAGGETATVTFDEQFDQAGEYAISVNGVSAGTLHVGDIVVVPIAIVDATAQRDVVAVDDPLVVNVTLENTGDSTGFIQLHLVVDGEPAFEEATNASVDAGETKTVSLPSVSFEEPGTVGLSVNGVDAGTVEVITNPEVVIYGASVSPASTLEPNETVTVTGKLYNSGPIDSTETIALEINGSVENQTTVDVNASSIEWVDLAWTPNESHLNGELSADFALTLNGFVVETITVENRYSEIEVVATSASADEVVAGEAVSVVGSIYQAGTIDGPETIELTATKDGVTEVVGTQTESLEPGYYHLGALNISATFDEAGTYDLELGGQSAGTVTVEPAISDVEVISAGTSTDAVVAGDEVFVVGSVYQNGTIDGPQTITLTATNTADETTTILGDQTVTLAPGFYHLGAINISATFDEAGTYDLALGGQSAGTVTVAANESDVQVIAASVSTNELLEGDSLYVVGSIYQNGTIDGPQEINLTATKDGTTEVVGSQNVSLSPGFYHLGAINITADLAEPGTYELRLGDRIAGNVTVIPARSDLEVVSASVSTDEVLQNETFHVVGSIYQNGTTDDPERVTLNATHQNTGATTRFESEPHTLTPGFYHLGAVNISAELADPGTYDLTLGDRDAGTLIVTEAYSDIEVISASVSEMNLTAGESFYVVGSIYQNGTSAEPAAVTLNATPRDGGSNVSFESDPVTLQPGFYHLGGVNLSAQLDEPGTYDLTLGDRDAGTVYVEEAPSDIQVIAGSLSEIEVLEGEELNVTGSVYQNGTVEATESIELTAIDQATGETTTIDSQDVTLAPGFYHLGAIDITFSIDDPGSYTLELGGHEIGELVVLEARTDVQVVSAGVSTDEVLDDESFYVVGSIYQNGTIDGPQELDLTATKNGTGETTVIGSQTVTLAPGFYHLGALNITAELAEPGTYDLALGEWDAGTVTVLEARSDIEVISASTSHEELVQGESLHVVGSLYQNGTVDGPQEIELTATNTADDTTAVLDSREVTLAPGFYHLGAINISATLDAPGTYDLELGGRDAGTVTVLAAEPDIQVIAASASTDSVVAGDELSVVGSLYQNGTVDGPQEIELTATNTDTTESIVVGSQSVSLAPDVYHLGAINITFPLLEPGTYHLELGGHDAGTVDVVEPTVEPSIVSVDGHSSALDPETGDTLVYVGDEGDDATVDVEIESDLDVEEVTLLLSSQATTFSVSTAATPIDGDTWRATVPIDDVVDDGRYSLSVVATDEVGTPGFAATTDRLVVDRNSPSLSVSIQDVDSDDATVVVESDEPLSELSSVTVEFDDGTAETLAMTEETTERFTGTLEFDETGEYSVTAVGLDRAGNGGSDTASVVINTGFTLNDGEIVIDESGTSITFEVAGDADEAILTQELFLALSENSVNANLDGGQLGVGFITAELDSFLDYQLEAGVVESANISLAIDDQTLPAGVSPSDAQIHYYNESTGQWDPIDTTYKVIDGESFLVASVTHFSTYGGLVTDDDAPRLVDVATTESDGSITVRFEYEDSISGVDVSSVSLSVDGTTVTTDSASSITSTYAEHTLDSVAGSSHDAVVTVADQAGNSATYQTSFTVSDGGSSSSSGAGSSSGSGSGAGSGSETTAPPGDSEDVEPPSETDGPEETAAGDEPTASEEPPIRDDIEDADEHEPTSTTDDAETPTERRVGLIAFITLLSLLAAAGLGLRRR